MQQESEDIIRCFIALPVPKPVRDDISRIQSALKQNMPGAKWVKSDGLHITLKFLGEITPAQVENVKTALRGAVSGTAFELGFMGIGVFPGPAKARVLWVGIERGKEQCIVLSKVIENTLERAGFPKEKRPFRAHLTLARFRNPAPLKSGVTDMDFDIPAFPVDRMVLYRSILKPSGAEYSELASFPLRQNDDRSVLI